MKVVISDYVALDSRTIHRLSLIENDPFALDNARDILEVCPEVSVTVEDDILYVNVRSGLVFKNHMGGVAAFYEDKFVCEYKAVSSVLDVTLTHIYAAANIAGILLSEHVLITHSNINGEIKIS